MGRRRRRPFRRCRTVFVGATAWQCAIQKHAAEVPIDKSHIPCAHRELAQPLALTVEHRPSRWGQREERVPDRHDHRVQAER